MTIYLFYEDSSHPIISHNLTTREKVCPRWVGWFRVGRGWILSWRLVSESKVGLGLAFSNGVGASRVGTFVSIGVVDGSGWVLAC